jgi:FkbM family methyltransferase
MEMLNTGESSSRGLVRRFFSPCMRCGYRLASPKVRDRLARVPGVLALYKRILKPLLFRAASGDGLATISFPTFVMYVDPRDTMGDMAMGEAWEEATTEVFKQVIKPGDVIVDVGAHWGYFSLLAATLCTETGRVYAFEPHPKNFAMLARNIAANHLTNVVTVQSAVSNCDASAQMLEARGSMGHSVSNLPQEWRVLDGATPRSISVRTVKLDNFFANNPLRPRLVKMDIEGAEPLALAGMRCLIEHNPSLVLIMEFNPTYLNGQAAAGFLDQLTACGFDVGIIIDDQRQLAVGPKAAVLKRLVDDGITCNLIASRDRSVFEHLFQRQDSYGKQLGCLERVGL